jgi:hypothetical protein
MNISLRFFGRPLRVVASANAAGDATGCAVSILDAIATPEGTDAAPGDWLWPACEAPLAPKPGGGLDPP